MEPYYEHNGITIYHGDCRDVLPGLGKVDCIITDPPYGMKWDGRVSRGKNSNGSVGGKSSFSGTTIIGDNEPFDPSPWIDYDSVILWGSNHYARKLPIGTTLVWIKRLDGAFGTFLSDAEVAWMKGGHGVYCLRDLTLKADERNRKHPTQKPLPLMKWCIEKTKSTGIILDPFMGSGTTLRAAKDLGRKAIGIELEEKYCEIAAKRLSQEVLPF